MMQRRVLFLLRKPPYGSAVPQEMLDAMLVAGVFEQEVSVLFMDDAVYQLLKDQDGGRLGVRDMAKALTALPTYDVDRIYVDANSLERRGLTPANLVLDAQPLSETEVATLLSRQQTVLSG